MVTSVVSNLSHSDYLNYQSVLTTSSQLQKRKARVIFVIVTNNKYLPQFPQSTVASLALIIRHSDYQWLLTTNIWHFTAPQNSEILKSKVW